MNELTSLSASTSTSPSASQLESPGISSSPDGPPNNANNSYAFLIHSQDSVNRNLPPEVDNKPLARQKRRRTSPEDQAILEAEYQRNSKPDKAARLKIVEQVALGEKEVQIWFQNRRQNFRRKEKPLLPHELPPPPPPSTQQQHPGSVMNIAAITSSVDEGVTGALDDPFRADAVSQQQSRVQPSTPSAITNHLIASARTALSFNASQGSQTSATLSPFEADTSFETVPTEVNSSQYTSNGIDHSRRGKTGSRDLSMLSYGRPPTLTNSQTPLLASRRSSSSLQLRLSFDGKAQVVEADEDDDPFGWSQPIITTRGHPSQHRIRGLQRSHSAILSSEEFRPPSTGLTPPRGKFSAIGRLPGSREWEIFCDGSTIENRQMMSGGVVRRGELSVDVVPRFNLHRPLPAIKSMIPSRRESSSSKRAAATTNSKIPKLGRATSSLARLQTYSESADEPPLKRKPSPSSTQLHVEGGESDKENCAPEDEVQPQGLRQDMLPRQSTRAVLGESGSRERKSNPMKRAGKALTGHRRRQRTKDESEKRKESVQVEVHDDDNEEKKEPSIVEEEEEELNCVQTLLSLSQGSWR
ncbi:MAG: hypothetical protein M1823_001353 [Watsoniomyces obsoletus]|nr:MAG: hypothetical protein M1823_001353 [Watsoniomyces obsoletus]